ncbi:MAG: MMPL family transporter [Clostridia bacterium]|nr:MMPL family transporter [Clostridia bacterium]MDY4083579.1 MMPL family transporter [Eubacteriales bacterium]
MTKLATWIMNHKIVIICVVVLLLALSVVGMLMVEKEGDVISYLDKDTETIIAKKLLESEFDIIGDCSISISFASQNQVKKIVDAITNSNAIIDGESATLKSAISKTVWIGTFDKLDMLDSNLVGGDPADVEQALALVKSKFVKVTDKDGNIVDDSYTGEKYTTYIVSFYFKYAGSDQRAINSLREIENIVKSKLQDNIDNGSLIIPQDMGKKAEDIYFFGGNSTNARKLVESSIGDMPKFFAVVVLVVLVILLITTKSYFEPLIFLATLGISLLLNMGSNVIAGGPLAGAPLGTISSITSSCSTILQLAIAMDYSIFLMHTYYEELEHCMTPKEALIKALPKTIAAISSSALTTVGGFVALFFMKYKMGYDLGFVLAKGVILSLLAVIFIQPILILIFDKLVKKTTHKWQVEVRLKPVAKVVTKKWVVVVVTVLCLALAIPCAYFQLKAPLNYITMTKENPNPNFPEKIAKKYDNMLIIMTPYTGSEDIDKQYEFIDKINKIGYQIDDSGNIVLDQNGVAVENNDEHKLIEVFSLCTILNRNLYDDLEASSMKDTVYSLLHSNFISHIKDEDVENKYLLYTINMEGVSEDVESYATLNRIKEIGQEVFGQKVSVTGLSQGAYELSLVTPQDFALVSLLSAAIILIILLVTFRKPLLSILLLLVIETGIFINLSLVYFTNTKINFMAYLIVTAIELGATVDYAILMTSKFNDEKSKGVESVTAIKNAIYRAAPSVLTSGAILIAACISVRLITSNMIVGQITELIARGAFMSLILVFTFLPALLYIRAKATRAISIKRGKGDPEEGLSTQVIFEKPVAVVAQGEVELAPIVGVADPDEVGTQPIKTEDEQNDAKTEASNEQAVENEVTVEVEEKPEE